MSSATPRWKKDPQDFFEDDVFDAAVASVQKYQRNFTGRFFETLAAESDPNEFTASDILAVSMLSVQVPAAAAIWILDDGAKKLSEQLKRIPPGQQISDDDADVTPDGTAFELWRLVRAQKGIGRVIASKLLAAKRPGLVPIYDQHVASALFEDANADDWALWQDRLRAPQGDKLRLLASIAGGSADPTLSILRVVDIVVWMQVHGDPL